MINGGKQHLEVIQPGLQTLLVDGGRLGHFKLGVTTGGPMDSLGFYWSNRLVNNPEKATVLEVTGGHFSFRCNVDTSIAVTGADAALTIDNTPAKLWQTLDLAKGQVVNVGSVNSGLRNYVSIAGELQVSPTLGSTSAVPREGIGGSDGAGSGLQPGECLPIRTREGTPKVRLPKEQIPNYQHKLTLRVVEGFQHLRFAREQRTKFYASTFTLSQRMDRMGCRLNGPAVVAPDFNMVSEGMCAGAVQVPPDGQPIVMLSDHQTIGGYPKLGSVLSIDRAKLGQCPPGTQVKFEPIDIHQAHNLLHLQQYRLASTHLADA